MSGRDRSQPPEPPGAEALQHLARDWITLWQSELAAMAVDREAQEVWHVLLSLWAGAAGAMLGGLPRSLADEPARDRARPAWPDAAPGSPPVAAAPDPRDAEVEHLRERVADLERRLAGLERGRD